MNTSLAAAAQTEIGYDLNLGSHIQADFKKKKKKICSHLSEKWIWTTAAYNVNIAKTSHDM